MRSEKDWRIPAINFLYYNALPLFHEGRLTPRRLFKEFDSFYDANGFKFGIEDIVYLAAEKEMFLLARALYNPTVKIITNHLKTLSADSDEARWYQNIKKNLDKLNQDIKIIVQ